MRPAKNQRFLTKKESLPRGKTYAQTTQINQAKIADDVREGSYATTPEKPGHDSPWRNPPLTCFHPLDAAQGPEGGKPVIFKKGQRPETLAPGWEPMQLECGQCRGCRIDKSKEWAARCVHEAQMHQENSFITLTYDDEHLPYGGTLVKEHFQLFMKKLRRKYGQTEIRYYHCGEYGDTLGRPHYHACLFGIDFPDRLHHSMDNNIVTYTSDTLTKIWGKGFTTCGELNYETAAYTARYIMKKMTGKKAEQHYERIVPDTGEIIQLQPEYTTMSLGNEKGDGLGARFYKKYKSDFFPRDECPIPGKGVYKGVPKYYERLYKETDPDAYEEVKRRRKLYRDSHADEYTPRRLKAKEIVKEAQLAQLPRS